LRHSGLTLNISELSSEYLAPNWPASLAGRSLSEVSLATGEVLQAVPRRQSEQVVGLSRSRRQHTG